MIRPSKLRRGGAWGSAIRRQIKSGALFIPIFSVNAHAQVESYFRPAWKRAVDRPHLMAPDQAFLLPVVVDGTPLSDERIPERFRECSGRGCPAEIRRHRSLSACGIYCAMTDPKTYPAGARRIRQ